MKKITLLLLLTLNLSIQAQNYTFSNLTGTYANLVGSTSLNNGEVWDDPEYNLTLPFQFTINGNVNSNFIVYDSNISQQITGTGTVYQVLAPAVSDLIDRGDGSETSLSPISYKIDGTIGSRIAKIEFRNCGSYDDTDLTMFVNFQVWLYEGSNIIEYRYGPSLITDSDLFYFGETGAIIGVTGVDLNDNFSNTHFLTGPVSSPTLSTVNDIVYITGTPPANKIYRFTPTNLNNQQNTKSTIAVYPNPFNDFVTVAGLESEFSYTILDINGKLIQSGQSNTGEQQIDTKSISTGVYILKIVTDTTASVRKIIKM